MKKTIFPVLFFTALLILYFSGPQIATEMIIPPPIEIGDPDSYISDSESLIHDMRPDNDKKIIWAGEKGLRTEHSIIYLHGFTSSRRETEPLSDIIAEETGSNLFYTRLKGHGRYELRSQENVNISDWLEDAAEALEIGKKTGNKVIIISCSTGTDLATWLAEQYPDDIEAIIMISPNFEPADKRILLLSRRWGPVIAKMLEGDIIGEKEHIVSPEHANSWSYIYRTEMIFPLVALLKYTGGVDFSKIDIPVLMLYSSADRIVNYKKTLEIFDRWGSERKKIIEIENPGDRNAHVIAGNIFSPETTESAAEKILAFLKEEKIIK